MDAPARPKRDVVPLLTHLRDETTPKQDFGLYNALAVMAYLLRGIGGHTEWTRDLKELISTFPSVSYLGIDSMGFPARWSQQELWWPTGSG